jgi:hypothetical protein
MVALRHGAQEKPFRGTYAPSKLGSFLRAFTFGRVGWTALFTAACADRQEPRWNCLSAWLRSL